MANKKVLFLDRDGVINKVLIVDKKPFSPRKFEEFELLPGVANALIFSEDIGFKYIIITNQPDIARGLMVPEELKKMHTFIGENLPIDDIIICPHSASDSCVCRKPKPGMFLQAQQKWKIDFSQSFMVGDSWKDMEAARRAGVTPVLIDADYNRNLDTEYRVENLLSAVKLINELVNESQQVFKEE